MRMGAACLTALLLPVAAAAADETLPALKAGTNTFSHVAILKVTATDVYFTSDQGLANVKLKDLGPDLQRRFNYNPTNATEMAQRQEEADRLYHAEISKPPPPPGSEAAAQVEPETGKRIWAKPMLNQPMAPLFIEKWLNGQPDNHGKFVLVEFWATGDPRNRLVIPLLNDFQKKFGDRMVIIGLSDEPEDVLRKFGGPEVDYFVASDTQGRAKQALGVTGLPHVVIVDPHGIIRWEGFPFLPHYELTGAVITNLFGQYSD